MIWAALWGFAEATLFFVVPDVLFTRTAVVSPKRGVNQFLATLAGAIAGGILMYSWAAASPTQARTAVASVPFLGEKIIQPAEARWNEGGTASLFANPLSGVPYKVPAILAPAHISLVTFTALSVPLRIERMLLSMIVFFPLGIWAGRGSEQERARRRRLGTRFHIAFWTIVYAVYWSINYS